MYASYDSSRCNPGKSRVPYHQCELLTFINIQLLEESGAISQVDAKASSQAVNYQDVPVSFNDNDDPASKDDEPEDPVLSFEVDMSAIGDRKSVV